MYQVKLPSLSPLPEKGPALLVCDHTSLGDPLVLLATAGRSITFLMAEEIYHRRGLNWVFKDFGCVPVRRGKTDIRAVRMILQALDREEVVGLFPEGGLDQHRDETGHVGIGYLALKTGVPVIPASIMWDRSRPMSILATLLIPCRAHVRYGAPLDFSCQVPPTRSAMRTATKTIMTAIQSIRQAIMAGSIQSNRQPWNP